MKRATVLLIAGACAIAGAQEVKFINLTNISQRTTLRYPPSLPGTMGGYGGSGVSDCAPNWRAPQALGVSLMHIFGTEVDPARPFQVEFRVANTGQVSIDLPVSPDLSDLQPADPSHIFSYYSIALVASVVRSPRSRGFVQLYGSNDHAATMLTLKPGEWIGIKANIKLDFPPPNSTFSVLGAGFWLRKNTYYPHAGGSSSQADNVCPNMTPTLPVKVHWFHPAGEHNSGDPANH